MPPTGQTDHEVIQTSASLRIARAVSADSDAATDTNAAAAGPSAGQTLPVPASGSTAESQPAEASAGVLRASPRGCRRSRDQFTEGLASLVLVRTAGPCFAGGP